MLIVAVITQVYTCVTPHRTVYPPRPTVPHDNLKNICTNRTDLLLGWRWGNSAIMNDRLILVTKERHFFKALPQHTQPLCPNKGLSVPYLPFWAPIHHMHCDWYPEILPAGCPPRTPNVSCSQSNILVRPFPLVHRPSSSSNTPACARLQASARALPHLPSVLSGLSSDISSSERSFLSPQYTAAQTPPHSVFP